MIVIFIRMNIPYRKYCACANDFVPWRNSLPAWRCPSSRGGATAPDRWSGSGACRCAAPAPGSRGTPSAAAPPRLPKRNTRTRCDCSTAECCWTDLTVYIYGCIGKRDGGGGWRFETLWVDFCFCAGCRQGLPLLPPLLHLTTSTCIAATAEAPATAYQETILHSHNSTREGRAGALQCPTWCRPWTAAWTFCSQRPHPMHRDATQPFTDGPFMGYYERFVIYVYNNVFAVAVFITKWICCFLDGQQITECGLMMKRTANVPNHCSRIFRRIFISTSWFGILGTWIANENIWNGCRIVKLFFVRLFITLPDICWCYCAEKGGQFYFVKGFNGTYYCILRIACITNMFCITGSILF